MDRLRVLVAGMVAGDPGQGGATWSILQYVLGLQALGHRVHLVEPVSHLDSASVRYFDQLLDEFGLAECATLLATDSRETRGAPYSALAAAAEEADLLLNVSGMLREEALIESVPVRAFLDLDPAFNQLWHAVEGVEMGFDLHNRFVTIGLGLGGPECPVPTCGRDWLTTPQPVVLSRWSAAHGYELDAFTSVGNWRAYGSIEWNGVHYGQRAHSLRALRELPERTSERLLLALAIHRDESPDLELLERHGWEHLDPQVIAATPASYRRFIRRSKAELGIAKSGYVASRSGWFSDRSACYLASGRPVVAQETGFSEHLPTGEGLLAFSTVDEAAAAIDRVASEYTRHAKAARELAADVFDSNKVLERLLVRLA